VIAGAYFTLVGRIGAGKAAYSTPAVPAGGPDDFNVLRRLRLAQQRGYRADADSVGNW
jgi:hypothetical protein